MCQTCLKPAGKPMGVSAFQTPIIICQIWVAYNILPHLMLILWAALHVPAYTPHQQRRLEHVAIAREREQRARARVEFAMASLRKARAQALPQLAPPQLHRRGAFRAYCAIAGDASIIRECFTARLLACAVFVQTAHQQVGEPL